MRSETAKKNETAKTGASLRYASTGERHRDFHASILDGVNYLLDTGGEEALRDVLFRTGTETYRTLHEKLVAGDPSELIAWWRYYMDREGADYSLEETADGAVLTVRDCPALKHLDARGIPGGKGLCAATRLLNEAFCSGSPFDIALEETGARACRQVLRRTR